MSTDCQNPKNDQERSLCSCLVATEANKRASDAYTAQLAIYNAKFAEHERENRRLQQWQNKINDFQKFQKYDGVNREFWANQHDGTCWAGENWGAANDWCHNAANNKGYDGENYWAKEWGWCSARWGNFKCKKPDEIVNAQINEYNSVKPNVPPHPGNTPQFELKNNIQCCSQIFSDITVQGKGDIELNNISQNCSQRLNEELNKITQPPKSETTSTTTPAPKSSNISSNTLESSQINNEFLIIMIILLSLCVSFIIIIIFVMNTEDIDS